MIIKRTWDIDDIRSVLCHPDIYPCIADDNSPGVNEFKLPLDGNEYHGCYVNDEIIGVMIYHVDKGRTYCHIQVLPEFRREFAYGFAVETLDEQLKKNGSIYAEIPDLYQNVLRFALDVGFKVIEVQKGSYLKGGELYDIKVLRCDYGICQAVNG